MGSSPDVDFDEIGYWSEIKLDIVRKYAQAYSTILSTRPFEHVYIDAFAGAGVHVARSTGQFVRGSPLNALLIEPPFQEFFLIDMDAGKAEHLARLVGDRSDVFIYEGDCNEILLEKVFPKVRYEDYRRGLCLLDPYGLHLNWEIIQTAGQMQSIEIFLNFPVADMNRNVLWHDPSRVSAEQAQRLTTFWGDDSWKQAGYSGADDLFGHEEKQPNEVIAAAFQRRLKEIANFKYVPEPMPMRNSRGAIVYYLFFASPNQIANHIVTDIFQSYRDRGV
jgi:three-Cys-motif partner protein